GWQMLFIVEGVPSIVVGILLLFWMTEKPDGARWLSDDEKRWITNTLQAEIVDQGPRAATTIRQGFVDRRVLLVMVFCFFLVLSNFGVVFWLPQIVKSLGNLSVTEVGFLTALPYLLACAAMIFWGAHSDKTGDRRWHLFIGGLVGAVGLVGSAVAPS